MEQLPTLQTERLTLRAFTLADAPRVREPAGAHEDDYKNGESSR